MPRRGMNFGHGMATVCFLFLLISGVIQSIFFCVRSGRASAICYDVGRTNGRFSATTVRYEERRAFVVRYGELWATNVRYKERRVSVIRFGKLRAANGPFEERIGGSKTVSQHIACSVVELGSSRWNLR